MIRKNNINNFIFIVFLKINIYMIMLHMSSLHEEFLPEPKIAHAVFASGYSGIISSLGMANIHRERNHNTSVLSNFHLNI